MHYLAPSLYNPEYYIPDHSLPTYCANKDWRNFDLTKLARSKEFHTLVQVAWTLLCTADSFSGGSHRSSSKSRPEKGKGMEGVNFGCFNRIAPLSFSDCAFTLCCILSRSVGHAKSSFLSNHQNWWIEWHKQKRPLSTGYRKRAMFEMSRTNSNHQPKTLSLSLYDKHTIWTGPQNQGRNWDPLNLVDSLDIIQVIPTKCAPVRLKAECPGFLEAFELVTWMPPWQVAEVRLQSRLLDENLFGAT